MFRMRARRRSPKPRVRRTVRYCRRLRGVFWWSHPSRLVAFPEPLDNPAGWRDRGLFRPVFKRPIKSRLVGAINADSAREPDSPFPPSRYCCSLVLRSVSFSLTRPRILDERESSCQGPASAIDAGGRWFCLTINGLGSESYPTHAARVRA